MQVYKNSNIRRFRFTTKVILKKEKNGYVIDAFEDQHKQDLFASPWITRFN